MVLYDASGVRYAAGRTAARVNSRVGGNEISGSLWENPLKENLGHTKLEVLAGSVIGPLVALPGLALIGTPLHLIQQLSQLLSPSLPAALG